MAMRAGLVSPIRFASRSRRGLAVSQKFRRARTENSSHSSVRRVVIVASSRPAQNSGISHALIAPSVAMCSCFTLPSTRWFSTGRAACIHMSDIPSFPYDLLWREKRIVSVANLARRDGLDFPGARAESAVRTEIEVLPLAEANEALRRLRAGELTGAAVLMPEHAAR